MDYYQSQPVFPEETYLYKSKNIDSVAHKLDFNIILFVNYVYVGHLLNKNSNSLRSHVLGGYTIK